MTWFDESEVRRFYDRNTRAFVTFGQGGGEGAIHRAVWGPGVATREQAFHYVDDRITAMIQKMAPPPRCEGEYHVVDLGCGVGGSLCYLAARLPLRGTGITISPVQARVGSAHARAAGVSDRVTILEGSFTRLPDSIPQADVAFAIESFVHGDDAVRFFAECHRLVKPGGRLVICDDLRRPTSDPRAVRVLDRFQRGWHVNTLITAEELRARGEQAGFTLLDTQDLTPYLELQRPRDRTVQVLASVFGRLPLYRTRIGHLFGGSALQRALAEGWLSYELTVFAKS